MSFKQSNYWLDTATPPAATPGDLPARVDVAIVGAGFTGLSAARNLAKRGAKLAVLEANTIGWGASSRNGGMVLTGMKLDVETLAARYGMESAKRMYAASLASIAFVEQIVREEHIDCNFSRSGHLEVACKQSHFDSYARSVEVIGREFKHQLRVVSKKDLRSEIGSDIYFGGIVDDVSAGLNPARYVAGLGRAALAAGAAVFENTRVEQISRASEDGTSRLSAQHFPRTRLCQRRLHRHQRVHIVCHSGTAEEDHSHRLFHHCHRAATRCAGAGAKSAQSHDL